MAEDQQEAKPEGTPSAALSDTGATPKKKGQAWRPKKGSVPDNWQDWFAATLRETANVRASCETAKVSRRTAYRHRKKNVYFRQAWDEALEDACDLLEAKARTRAMESSDLLMIFLLKAHRPEKYKDISPGGPIEPTEVTDARLRLIDRLDRIARAVEGQAGSAPAGQAGSAPAAPGPEAVNKEAASGEPETEDQGG